MNSTTRLKLSFFLLSFLVLAACTASTCPATAIRLHQWSKQEQKQAAEEISQFPDDSILSSMLMDYARLRRQVEQP